MVEYINRNAVLGYLNDIWLTATPTDSTPAEERQPAICRCMGLQDAMDAVREFPAADVVEVVRCKDCVHRPEAPDGATSGVDVEAPRDEEGWSDETCPYLCADPWYNIMPHDDWFCHYGERKENG